MTEERKPVTRRDVHVAYTVAAAMIALASGAWFAGASYRSLDMRLSRLEQGFDKITEIKVKGGPSAAVTPPDANANAVATLAPATRTRAR